MAQATIPTPDLAALEVRLQQQLQTHLPDIAPVQVNCYVKRETLLMVVQHRSPALPHPSRLFRLLVQQFVAERLDQRYRGLMYLKVDGRPQPYAFHTHTPQPPDQDIAAQVYATTPEGLAAAEDEAEISLTPAAAEDEAEGSLTPAAAALAPRERLEAGPPERFQDADLNLGTVADADFEADEAAADLETDEEGNPVFSTPWPGDWPGETWLGDRLWPTLIAVAAVFGLTVFFTSLYLVSRPCVFRRCEPLTLAQELADEALTTLQNPPSGQSVLQAQQQLQQAIALLESIPTWSHAHREAAGLLLAYGTSAERVAELVEGLQTAARAAAATQNPPLGVERWQEAQRLWRGAIAILEEIPTDSEFAAFARQKVREYRENLTAVNRRLDQEREAVEHLAAALEAAKIAEVRGGVAQSLDHLQLTVATWQTVVDRLAAIPSSTTPYATAQQRLEDYRPRLTQARDRLSRERFAHDAYNQGDNLGRLAITAQGMNQWEQAVTHWRNALNYLEQVPSESFAYAKAQPLLERSAQSLNTAQSRLEEKVQVRQARTALTRLCASTDGTICVYTATESLLSVRLTPTYVQRVRQTAQQAQRSNDVEVQAGLLDHIFHLEKALEAISEDTGIPLEIYTTDNVLVKRHRP